MNKFTSVVIPSYLSFIELPTIEMKFGISYASYHFCDEILSWMIEIWMKTHLVSAKK